MVLREALVLVLVLVVVVVVVVVASISSTMGTRVEVLVVAEAGEVEVEDGKEEKVVGGKEATGSPFSPFSPPTTERESASVLVLLLTSVQLEVPLSEPSPSSRGLFPPAGSPIVAGQRGTELLRLVDGTPPKEELDGGREDELDSGGVRLLTEEAEDVEVDVGGNAGTFVGEEGRSLEVVLVLVLVLVVGGGGKSFCWFWMISSGFRVDNSSRRVCRRCSHGLGGATFEP